MPPAASKKKRRSHKDDENMEEWRKAKQLLKPKDQVELTESELTNELARVLVTTNLQQPDSLVQYSYATGEFVPIPFFGEFVTLYNQKGTLIHLDSDEARQQLIAEGIDPNTYSSAINFATSSAALLLADKEEPPAEEEENEDEEEEEGEGGEPEGAEEEKPEGEGEGEGEDEGEGGGEGEGEEVEGEGKEGEETESAAPKSKKPKKIVNKFNFCERAALTYNNPTRSQETQTFPPPTAKFSAQVHQWLIYDNYQADFDAQQLLKELERERLEKEKTPVSKGHVQVKKVEKKSASEERQERLFECWKVLERMINQNTYHDIAQDYRYWDDPSDEYRAGEGTLLPLWKFCLDKTRKNTVTDILWNPWYYDLFAVCFGFLDFMKPLPEGALCLFTIKNPSYPEHICMTDSCVMCVDIHRNFPYMIVIGLYDGSVIVYNVQQSCKRHAYKSNNMLNKHAGIVWEVKWAPDLPDGELNFYSISADGKINNWVLMQSELSVTTIFILYLPSEPVPGPDGTLVKKKGCASCIKFHPKNDLIYLVGTEEGIIYKCSILYSAAYMLRYEAHQLPVYRIDFNKFNSDIFISCSGDWRIKIWEDNRLEPLFVFDVGACVGDVKWAPYSSTVFAAATSDGKVYVFDLNVNKYKPICVQAIVSKKRSKLTRLDFNYKLPILIAGDDKGTITTLKLSPNLRIPCKPPKKQQHLDQFTLQCMKLDSLLAVVREPLTLTLPPDTADSTDS